MIEEGLSDVIPDLHQDLPQLGQRRWLVLKTEQSSFHFIPHFLWEKDHAKQLAREVWACSAV